MTDNMIFGKGKRPKPHWVIVPRYSVYKHADYRLMAKELKLKGLSIEFTSETQARNAANNAGYTEAQIEICEAEWL